MFCCSFQYGYTARKRSLIEDAKFEHNVLNADPGITEEAIEKDLTQNELNVEIVQDLIISVENITEDVPKILAFCQVTEELRIS